MYFSGVLPPLLAVISAATGAGAQPIFPPDRLTIVPAACSGADALNILECCPVPTGFDQACGGAGRGQCADLSVPEWSQAGNNWWIPDNDLDARWRWPTGVATRVCECEFPFYGPDCSLCAYGRYGENCEEEKILVRKNANALSDEGKAQMVEGFRELRRKPSDYRIPVVNVDDDGAQTTEWLQATVYDTFIWIHFLPIWKGGRTGSAVGDVNMAHDAPSFLTWHRLLMLWFEREMQVVLDDEDFALPYWDWTDDPDECSVCNGELIGAANETDFVGAPFDNWDMICYTPDDDKEAYCDPRVRNGQLLRSNDPVYSIPRQESIDACMKFPEFDVLPYDYHSSCSFRNCLEGYIDTATGHFSPRILRSANHNVVHRLFGGTLKNGAIGSGQSATNDPMFWLHHGNVDRIMEAHMRRYKPTALAPASETPFGHGGDAPLIGIWPITPSQEMFKMSEEFGYTYEFLDEEGRFPTDGNQDPSTMQDECLASLNAEVCDDRIISSPSSDDATFTTGEWVGIVAGATAGGMAAVGVAGYVVMQSRTAVDDKGLGYSAL